ncbi:MAG TPA: RDD family protein [Marmoricola sp.]|nr:RDD family protein [Marmoricola sp.]
MSDPQNPAQDPQFAPPPPQPGIPSAPPVAATAYGTTVALPPGVVLASRGRRVGAYFLEILLVIVTLVIGWVIWGLVVWGKGTSPALQVLGMRAWKPAEGKVAGYGTMALRSIVGYIVQGLVGIVTQLISLVLFLTDDQNRNIPDRIAGTVIVHDPNKVLG